MRLGIIWLSTAFLAALVAFQAPHVARAAANEVVGRAVVLDDASLRIRNTVFRLHGIYVPATGRSCAFFLRPVPCADRAALALETRIQGFVHCSAVSRNRDGSVNAICFIRRKFYSLGEDLAAYLLSRGLALALPGAPFEYVALERIAQTRQLGFWGLQVDAIVPGRARSR
jgi:endonuclease YncB( thermonuclease family)